MLRTDFHYTTDGVFVSLFANNAQAETVYGQIAETFGGVAKIPAHMFGSIKSQLKDAGYSVRKSTKRKPVTVGEIDALLSQLEA